MVTVRTWTQACPHDAVTRAAISVNSSSAARLSFLPSLFPSVVRELHGAINDFKEIYASFLWVVLR